ncbi:MAG: hypothetical protein HY903_04005 [Deltaproteobacteria bacterium]|nr:hypothetical protein [Deltaproteobacteria bacterium]
MALRRLLLALTGLVAAMPGCGEKQDPAPSPGECDVTNAVSYAGDIRPLFESYCLPCHSATAADRQGAPAGLNFDTYAEASANAALANSVIQPGLMPPDFLGRAPTDGERCRFQAWVDAGAPDN